jgi:hypothetical protein
VPLKVVPKAACASKIVPKAGYDMYTGEIRPMNAKESQNINTYTAFGTIFRIIKCFQRSMQDF